MPYRSRVKFVSRILSLSGSRDDANRVPIEELKKVPVDAYLMSMGLLSQPFAINSYAEDSVWMRGHQLLVLTFHWFMLLKWLSCSVLPEEMKISPEMIGDFTAYLPGQQFDYHFVFILWSLIGAFSTTLFYIARNDDKLNLLWLQPFELCKGAAKPQDLGLSLDEASDFWQRVLSSLAVILTAIRVLIVMSSAGVVFLFVKYWPEEHLYSWGLFWGIVTIIWLYYNISIEFGVMGLFHVICYYFWVKFRRLNEMAKGLENSPKQDLMVMHQRINYYMTTHNSYAKELALYNKFWQYYLVLDFVVYIVTICYFIQCILFLKAVILVKIVLIVAIFGLAFCLVFTAFSAGAVADEIHAPYSVLNAVSQNQMPLVLKTQLQIYIQRIGGPAMGFSCWDLFTITFDGFLSALLMIGSFFLLFMDVSQTEKRKRRFPIRSMDTSKMHP